MASYYETVRRWEPVLADKMSRRPWRIGRSTDNGFEVSVESYATRTLASKAADDRNRVRTV